MKFQFEKELQRKMEEKKVDSNVAFRIKQALKEICESRYPEIDGIGYKRTESQESIMSFTYYPSGTIDNGKLIMPDSFNLEIVGKDDFSNGILCSGESGYEFTIGNLWIKSDIHSLQIAFLYGNDYIYAKRIDRSGDITVDIYLNIKEYINLNKINFDNDTLVPDKTFKLEAEGGYYYQIPDLKDDLVCTDLYSLRLLASLCCDWYHSKYVDSFKPNGEKVNIIKQKTRYKV
jgi:hypothetical protein